MIREFWVENYKSIKDRQILNFETKKGDEDIASVSVGNTRINKLSILYGANASGKSNFLEAIQSIFILLISSRDTKERTVQCYDPFILCDGQPITMYISFFVNEIKYDYEISYNKTTILKETLHYYPNGTKALFYERNFVSDDTAADITFGQSLKMTKRSITTFITQTLNNHSVLSTYSKTSFQDNVSPIANLFSWILNYVHNINGDQRYTFLSELVKDMDSSMKNFYLQMITKADFNIVDFQYTKYIMELSDEEAKKYHELGFSEQQIKFINERENVLFTSKAGDKSFTLDIQHQSSGTLELMRKLKLLYHMITADHTYFIDEPEKDLHYDLFLFYINAFLYNSSKSQLILASHLTSLLGEDLINQHRDLVFFINKDYNTATSTCSRADSFGLHPNVSLYNAYKIGKLGAKPALGSPFIVIDK